MYILVICVFGIAALFGLYLLSYVLFNLNTPKGVALTHGGFGALGIISLCILSFFYPAFLYALLLFILAAGGGFLIFVRDLKGKGIPKIFALGHGFIALIGFILLIVITCSLYQ